MEQVQKTRERPDAPRPNHTGIPGRMKRDFEGRSGLSFNDVRVHYNSGGPARLGALAYTRGTQVYLGPGQERYLPHELGHVVQQKIRPVPATRRGGGVPINDDPALEAEADRWSAGAAPGGGTVQMFRGQDVVQCAGGGGAGETRLKELYEYVVSQMPELTAWNRLSFCEDRSITGKIFGRITLKDIVRAAKNFKQEKTPRAWSELKRIIMVTSTVSVEKFRELWGDRGVGLYRPLQTLREQSIRVDQTVEAMAASQERTGEYSGLPEYISAAKEMVDRAVTRLESSETYYDAYFDPKKHWRGKPPSPGVRVLASNTIQPPALAKTTDAPPITEDQWDPEVGFSQGRQILLQWQNDGNTHAGLSEKWYGLQERRPGGHPEPQDLPQIEERIRLLPDSKAFFFPWLSGQRRKTVRYRYKRIYEGLKWLGEEPYLKVQFDPRKKYTYGMTYRDQGKETLIWLCGAFQRHPESAGKDSRPGVLIHELSHSFAGTQDHAYGNHIKNLSAGKAVENADTYEYAAEDAFKVSPGSTANAPPDLQGVGIAGPRLQNAAKQEDT